MKTKITSLILLSLVLSWTTSSQVPPGYYESVDGLSGLKLKYSLHEIISENHTSWNYFHLPLFYPITDSDHYYENDGTMLDIYSENPDGIDPYTYDWATAVLISGASEEGMGYNREHIISQSFFYGCYPMFSDLHFVIPADARVNQRRSNLPFGMVGTSTTFISLNGTKVGLSTSPGYSLTVFEPIDEFKGDIARMILYAAVRYEKLLYHFNTENTRNPFYENTEISIRPWLLNVLLEWHLSDPVSEKEIHRNNEVYNIQGNRNPFIDHPEYVDMIWAPPSSEDTAPPEVPIYLNVVAKGAAFLHMSWEPSEDMDLLGYEIRVDGHTAGRVKDNNYVITHLSPGTNYSIEVRSYDERYNFSDWSLTSTVATLSEDTFSRDIKFSKIIEGSDNNKAIEIHNNTGYTVDMSHYTIGMRQVNTISDALYWSRNELRLEGELQHGRSFVILHPEADLYCMNMTEADIVSASTPLYFDGILALRLRYKDNTVDIFGRPGNRDPFAEDQSVYRKENIKDPNTTFDMDEWDYYEKDYCEGLGNEPNNTSQIPVESQYDIFPVPVKNGETLHIKLLQVVPLLKVTIVNASGQIIRTFSFENTYSVEIPVENLPNGIYFINLDHTIKKIIVID